MNVLFRRFSTRIPDNRDISQFTSWQGNFQLRRMIVKSNPNFNPGGDISAGIALGIFSGFGLTILDLVCKLNFPLLYVNTGAFLTFTTIGLLKSNESDKQAQIAFDKIMTTLKNKDLKQYLSLLRDNEAIVNRIKFSYPEEDIFEILYDYHTR